MSPNRRQQLKDIAKTQAITLMIWSSLYVALTV